METEPTEPELGEQDPAEARAYAVVEQIQRLVDFLGDDRHPDEGPADAAIRLIRIYREHIDAASLMEAPDPLTSYAAAQRSADMLEDAWRIAHAIKDVDVMVTIAAGYRHLSELPAVRTYRPPDPEETSR